MSANSSDSEQSLTDWTLVDEDGKIQGVDSDSASSDFVTLEAETGAVEYRKHSKDDDIDSLEEHPNTSHLEQTSQSTGDGISTVITGSEVARADDSEVTAVKQPIKYFEMPAEETATVDYVESKTIDVEIPEEEVEVLTVGEQEEEEEDEATVAEGDKDRIECREIAESTETVIIGDDEVDGNGDLRHVEEVPPCMLSEEANHFDETLEGAVGMTYRLPLTLLPKHLSEDSSGSDSDFVRIEPSSFPDGLGCIGCQATGQLSSSCATCTSVSPASSLSNFSFLPLAVEGGDDPCDRPDSPDSLNDYDTDSDLSVIEDYDSQTALDELTPGATKPAVRRYRHYRDDGLNNKLNWVLILVVTAGIALGIGHFIGSNNEYHHKKKIQEGQIQRLKSLQNELLSCLEKEEVLEMVFDGVDLPDFDRSVCSMGSRDTLSPVGQESSSEQPVKQESPNENESENSEECSPVDVDTGSPEDQTDTMIESNESEVISGETETLIPDHLVSDSVKDDISVETLGQTDQHATTHKSDESQSGDVDAADEMQVTDSQVPEENENAHVVSEDTWVDLPDESDLDTSDGPEETEQPMASDRADDWIVDDTEQDLTMLEDDIGDEEYIADEQVHFDIASDDTTADAIVGAEVEGTEDLDTAEEESEVNISLVVSCQERVQKLSEELKFSQGRAEMWKRLFVNDHDDGKPKSCSDDDPDLSFFTCVNMFVPRVNISEAMRSLRHTPLANFSETVSKLYSDSEDAISNLSETIRDQWGKVNDFVHSEQFNTYVNASKEAVTSLNDQLKEHLDKVKNFTKSEEFADFAKRTRSAWSRVSETVSSKWQELKTYTTSDDFKSKVTQVGESIQKTWQSVQNYSNKILHGEDTSSTLESVTDTIKRTVDSTWQGVKDTVGQVLQKGKKRQRYHGQGSQKEDKNNKAKKRPRSFIRLPGEERVSLEDKIYDKETGDFRYKKSQKIWREKMKKARQEGPAVVDGEYRPGRVKNRKFLKKIRLPGEERDEESWFGFWGNEDEDGGFEEKKRTARQEQNTQKQDRRKLGCNKQKDCKKNSKERIRKEENIGNWETFEEDYDIQCHGNKQCISKQIEDARKLYVELLHYRQWLKDRHYKKDMRELEEFLSDLEEFMDDPHPDDKDLEELQEDFEEVLEDMEKRAKKHNRRQQKAREQQEKELEDARQKPDKELKKESMEEEEEVKDEKKQGFGHKKKGEAKGRARTKRREFHQETVVVQPAFNDPSYERAAQGENQEKQPDSTREEDADADWFFRRAEDREEQRGQQPKWQDDADPVDNWFFHRAQARSDDRTGITMWDMYNWFLERYEHREEWRSYQMDDQSNWFLRRP